MTILQTGVTDSARGRVMATLQASMSGASIASMALAGVFGELIGVRSVFFVGALVVGAGGVASFLLYRGIGAGEAAGAAEPAEPAELTRDADPARATA